MRPWALACKISSPSLADRILAPGIAMEGLGPSERPGTNTPAFTPRIQCHPVEFLLASAAALPSHPPEAARKAMRQHEMQHEHQVRGQSTSGRLTQGREYVGRRGFRRCRLSSHIEPPSFKERGLAGKFVECPTCSLFKLHDVRWRGLSTQAETSLGDVRDLRHGRCGVAVQLPCVNDGTGDY